ncbi:MAG: ABC transporter ATP-binding protein [Lachnospiraceae bacterium]|nr:ABC transporter ATP-binding protein [Lachnospiraceae bacterium]
MEKRSRGDDAHKSGDRFLALEGVSFTVKRGEALGIIGQNGAGKSTLLKLLSRVSAPTSGTISFNGRVASMLEVGTGFHRELTGRENIYMNGAILGMSKREIDAKFQQILEFSEIGEFIDTPVKRYSSGMYVKLAFSVMAHLDCEIMIMDEVLAVGDMAFQKKCIERMAGASKDDGRTLLYVSHNMNTIRQLCDRCIVLDKGHILYDGDVEKAISIYMQNMSESRLSYDYRNYVRNCGSWEHKIAIDSLEVLERDNVVLKAGETLKFRISARALRDVPAMKLRLQVASIDGVVVGTAFSDRDVSVREGVSFTAELKFSACGLSCGSYTCVLAAFEYNSVGETRRIDYIEDALRFEVEDKELSWDRNVFGYVKLTPLVVDSLEVEGRLS